MLAKLFRRLTTTGEGGRPLFDWITREARAREWYLDGAVPDTIDGRFALLSTIAALVFVRLEGLGEEGERTSVALAERFAEVMESEHRELGMGDPGLGKTVLKLVGALSQRVTLWRQATAGETEWVAATRDSLSGANDSALAFRAARLRDIADRLDRSSFDRIVAGEVE